MSTRRSSPNPLRHRLRLSGMNDPEAQSDNEENDRSIQRLSDHNITLTDHNLTLESTVTNLRNQIEQLKNREKKLMSALQASEDVFVLDEKTSLDESFGSSGCPIEPKVSFRKSLYDRAIWLIGLLLFQSCSSLILSANEVLLKEHPSIIFFLTMLVGAGGNAGNQSAVRVIRGIAVGSITRKTYWQFFIRELQMAIALSGLLGLTGLVRAVLSNITVVETMTVTVALMSIVFISVVTGASLPLLLQSLDIDPAHSSTTIQVIMDILGVFITCMTSTLLLDVLQIDKYLR